MVRQIVAEGEEETTCEQTDWNEPSSLLNHCYSSFLN